jgi:hypothetical protein
MKVNISPHAHGRWNEYCSNIKRTKLAAIVEKHLFTALRQGAIVQANAIQLDINHKVKAVVVPGKFGGWDVKTFYLRKEARKGALI